MALRWLPERAKEGAVHSLEIGKTCFIFDFIDGTTAIFHHRSDCFDPKVLNSEKSPRTARLRAFS